MLYLPKHIIKPARYTGIETNRVIKELKRVKVRFALCYPDIYEIGMSYHGLYLLYELINSLEGVLCERCFAPWHDMDDHLKKTAQPLTTLESRTPLSEMDMVGFSLSYELNVTNVLNMLKLSSIMIRAEEREDGPIIIGGGPLMLNPKPFEKFFDLIVVGEAEDAVVDILGCYKRMKGMDRGEIIEELNSIEGVYSPLYPKRSVKRLYVEDLNRVFHPTCPPIPVSGSVHNRMNIEISRGCGNGCRFCMAGFGYRPYRERSFERVKEVIDESLKKTGYEEVSLLSLSSGDYSHLPEVLSYIKEKHKGVSVSLPSLKIGSLTKDGIGLLGSIARTGFTFALESASREIRAMINKNIVVENLIDQIPVLKRYGWRRLKVYFMIGFPGEIEGDLACIREVVFPFERAGIELNISVSPFIPKPHTPFQWLRMEDAGVLNEKILFLKSLLKKMRARVKYRDIYTSFIEAIISRGDEKLSPLFEHLSDNGAKLEAWREFFNYDAYTRWFDEQGYDMGFYLGKREVKETLPWDFIDTGVEKSFIKDEFYKAFRNEITGDCYDSCSLCGLGCVSQRRERKKVDSNEVLAIEISRTNGHQYLKNEGCETLQTRRYTFRYGKFGDARYLGHIDTMNILLRAFRACGIDIKMRGRYHPMPKITLSEAIPVGVESVCEYIEIETDMDLDDKVGMLKKLNAFLPKGMKCLDVVEGKIKDMAKDCLFVIIREGKEVETELTLWRRRKGRFFYLWKGKSVKGIIERGSFKRIVKIMEGRI